MVDFGVCGFVVQICQLVGMCGLMVKLDGFIIEMLIIVNFCEGLNVFQYFIFIYGVCKGLVDIVLKIVNFGYLICCLVDVVQDLVVIEDDCGILEGIIMMLVIEGGDVKELLCDCVLGCVIVEDVLKLGIVDILVLCNMLLYEYWCDLLEVNFVDFVKVCFVVFCDIDFGVCVYCYGCDLVCGYFINKGEVIGVIVVQFIGELGIQLMMCMFYIGGVVFCVVVEFSIQVKNKGSIKFSNVKLVVNFSGKLVIIFCNIELKLIDEFGCIKESYKVFYGVVMVKGDGEQVVGGEIVVNWDLYIMLVIIEVSGFICFIDMIDGQIIICQIDELIGLFLLVVLDFVECIVGGKDLCLVLKIVDVQGNDVLISGIDMFVQYFLLGKVIVQLEDGVQISFGDILVCILQEFGGIKDIIGGLLCVVDLFEVCCLKELVILVEISGIIFFGKEIKGKCCLVIILVDGSELYEEMILKWCQFNVFEGECVECGDVVFDGLEVLYDILCLCGVYVVICYIVNEVQDVYCLQGVKINDKYIEVIVCQMLCKVIIESVGSFDFFEGEQVEYFCVKIVNCELEVNGKVGVMFFCDLLGIIKVFLVIEFFIFVVLFQEIICVLIEVVVVGKCDELCGLKENVIVGCLILVGIGYVYYQDCMCCCVVGELLVVLQVSVEEVFVNLVELLNVGLGGFDND